METESKMHNAFRARHLAQAASKTMECITSMHSLHDEERRTPNQIHHAFCYKPFFVPKSVLSKPKPK